MEGGDSKASIRVKQETTGEPGSSKPTKPKFKPKAKVRQPKPKDIEYGRPAKVKSEP
ncbi:unnamed protein product, partial [Heterosigma akashiwo]